MKDIILSNGVDYFMIHYDHKFSPTDEAWNTLYVSFHVENLSYKFKAEVQTSDFISFIENYKSSFLNEKEKITFYTLEETFIINIKKEDSLGHFEAEIQIRLSSILIKAKFQVTYNEVESFYKDILNSINFE